MMKMSLMFLALFIAACGSEFDAHDIPEQGSNSMCPVGDASCSPEGIITLTKSLYLEVWNATSAPEGRICYLAYSYTKMDGTTAQGTIVAAQLLTAGERRAGTLSIPYNQTVSISGGCWHPNPDINLRASNSLTTLPMDRARGCMLAYSEPVKDGELAPEAPIPCWY